MRVYTATMTSAPPVVIRTHQIVLFYERTDSLDLDVAESIIS